MSLETFERLPAEKRELIISVGIDEFSRKAYKDVCTDDITKKCGISKGILFHYFGSKKAYYFYCLSRALDCLTAETDEAGGEDFYEILFAAMNRKISVCRQHMAEMRLVNMASRDPSGDIAEQKAKLIHRYMSGIQAESERTLKKTTSGRVEEAVGAMRILLYSDSGIKKVTGRMRSGLCFKEHRKVFTIQ